MTDPTTSLPPTATQQRRDPVPLQEAIDLLAEAVVFFDADGLLVASNDSFRDAFTPIRAFTREGASWDMFLMEAERHELLPRATCDTLRLEEDRLAEGGSEARPVDYRTGHGQAYALRLRPTSNGGFALIRSEIVDHQGRAESDRMAELLMSKVLEACPANLTMSRIGDGQILYRTPAATDLLGTSRNSRDHFALREQRADFITALLPGAQVDDMRIIARRRDGSEFPASLSARLIDFRGDEVVVSNIIDLTDELAVQSELERQKDLAFQAEKMSALGELLAGVAHELNNPLSVVVGNAMMLAEQQLDAASMKRVTKVSDAADRCVKIVRTFLSMAREQPLQLESVDVRALAETAVDAYRSQTENAQAALQIDIPDGLPEVSVDEIQIVQVLLNLLINAEQAMAQAGIGDRIRIIAHRPTGARMLHMKIADNGPGVPAEIHGRIFDPLFTTKTHGKGTGVGLAFCHRVLSSHGGSIQLDRTRKDGAAFLLTLPLSGA